MLKKRTQRIMLLLLLLAIPGASSGATTEYSVRGLGQLVPGGSSIAYGVNDLGVAVGTAMNSHGSYTAVRFNLDGTVTDLGQLYTGYESAALDINNDGTIVGYAFTGYELGSMFISNAVVFNDDGTLTNLGLLIPSVSASAQAHAINNHGVIVGSATDSNDVSRAVIFEGEGVITPLGHLGLSPEDSVASAINDDGVIVGTSSLSKTDNAVQFHLDGSVTDLFSPREASSAYGVSATGEIVGSAQTSAFQPSPLVEFGALFNGSGGATNLGQLDSGLPAMALAVNASGTIVGFGDTDLQRTAVLFDQAAGTVVPLAEQIEAAESVTWILETAYAINDSGQIVGGGKPNPGDQTGYILTPVTEPAGPVAPPKGSDQYTCYSVSVTETMKVKPNCSKGKSSYPMTTCLADDGEWYASSEASDFGGTYVATGKSGRKLTLSFDEEGFAAYVESMSDWATELCGTAITDVTSHQAKKMQVKLNKQRTVLKIVVKDVATSHTASGSGAMKHSLKGKGSLIP